jgi:hypothetical protein
MRIYADHALIIPDVHMDVAWVERIFAQEKIEGEVIFLGDYLDSYHEPPRVATPDAVFEMLSRLIGDSRVTMLPGNHDVQYAYELKQGWPAALRNPHRCSGYRPGIGNAAAAWDFDLIYDDMEPCVLLNEKYLLSHAGIRPSAWHPSADYDDIYAALALQKDGLDPAEPYYAVGRERGGMSRYGGPLWQDWTTFQPIPGIVQIVGHTGRELPNKVDTYGNMCIDNNQTTYAVLEDGQIHLRRA